MNEKIGWTIIVVACLAAATLLPCNAKKDAKHKVDGEQVFKQHCASCHSGGGNSVNPKRPVAGSKQLNNLITFKDYLSAPPGHMPYYQDVVNDQETLKELYKYCKSLKKGADNQAYNGTGSALN